MDCTMPWLLVGGMLIRRITLIKKKKENTNGFTLMPNGFMTAKLFVWVPHDPICKKWKPFPKTETFWIDSFRSVRWAQKYRWISFFELLLFFSVFVRVYIEDHIFVCDFTAYNQMLHHKNTQSNTLSWTYWANERNWTPQSQQFSQQIIYCTVLESGVIRFFLSFLIHR